MRPIFELSLSISGRPEQVYLPFDRNWNDLERGHYLSRIRINAGNQNVATIQITPWTIIEVKPGALGQILHSSGDHK